MFPLTKMSCSITTMPGRMGSGVFTTPRARATGLITGSDTFPNLCGRELGNVSLPVIRTVECQLPGRLGCVEL